MVNVSMKIVDVDDINEERMVRIILACHLKKKKKEQVLRIVHIRSAKQFLRDVVVGERNNMFGV